MQDWALEGETKFTYHYKKSDSARNIVVCVHDDRPFRVSAIYSASKECVVVYSVDEVHNCLGAAPVYRGQSSQQSWLQRILPSTLPVTKTTTPQQIIDAVALHHKVKINYEAAKKAKKAALGDYLSQQAAQFGLLPDYKDAILRTDERSHVVLQTKDYDGVQRFHRFFLCPDVSRESFLHCHFLLAMDGTFTMEIFYLTILMAVSVDAGNHAVLLAWAIVESESGW